jgi:hypothetical protein
MNDSFKEWQELCYDPTNNSQFAGSDSIYFRDHDLSKSMKMALKDILLSKESLNKATIDALIKRKLVNDDLSFTNVGYIAALTQISLQKQCELLGIPLIMVDYEKSHSPEKDAVKYYEEQKWQGFHCEGKLIFDVITSIFISALKPIALEIFKTEDEAEYQIFNMNIFQKLSRKVGDITNSKIESISVEELINHYSIYRSWYAPEFLNRVRPNFHFEGLEEFAPRFEKETIAKTFQIFGTSNLKIIAELIFDRLIPRKGWPDLVLLSDNNFKLVEVKRTDKMHASQLVTLPKLIERGLNVEICKI